MKIRDFSLCFATALTTLLCGTAMAAPVTINNPSFENAYSGSNIPDWIKESVASSVITNTTFPPVSGPTSFPNGTHGVIVYGGGAGIYQTLSGEILAPSTTYTLQLDIAGTTSYQGFQIALVGGSSFTYLVQGLRTSNVATSDLAVGSNISSYSTSLSQPIQLGQWSTLTLNVTTTETLTNAGALQVFIRTAAGSTTDGNNNWTAFDNVRLSAVPEPSVVAALALAGAYMFIIGVRRTRKA